MHSPNCPSFLLLILLSEKAPTSGAEVDLCSYLNGSSSALWKPFICVKFTFVLSLRHLPYSLGSPSIHYRLLTLYVFRVQVYLSFHVQFHSRIRSWFHSSIFLAAPNCFNYCCFLVCFDNQKGIIYSIALPYPSLRFPGHYIFISQSSPVPFS